MAIVYLSIEDCKTRCFPYIRNHLYHESVPEYETDEKGVGKLSSALDFFQNDELYPTFFHKAAYMFCSISNSHAFVNGNKKLAATVLRYFLADNHVKALETTTESWKELTNIFFPSYEWKSIDVGDPLLHPAI
ncbi:MAG: Fic family protein [bacterium]|nr:Fic family protein [bacterium]